MNKALDYIKNYEISATTKKIIISVGALISVYQIEKMINQQRLKAAYNRRKQQALEARQKRDYYLKNTKIPDHGISQDIQQKILECSLQELKQMLDNQFFTSEQLLNFYAQRMHTIGLDHQLITESNYTAALERAKQCDTFRKQHPDQVKGELFGIVMTIKDTIDLKGLASTVGCVIKLQDIPQDDGLIVKVLQNAGAIIFAKTNIPQTAMILESTNQIWGTALNPWNKKRSCGGSSGGSGGSVAAKVTPLCFGSDIGGSIRIPSHFNGVTGFKPGTTRLTSKGHAFYSPSFSGQTIIPNAVGPIGRTVDDCALVMEAMLNKDNQRGIKKSQQDLYTNIVPWDKQKYNSNKKLKIGYYKTSNLFMPASVIQRAVMEAVDALKKKGHELIEIDMVYAEQMYSLFFNTLFSDNLKNLHDFVKDEQPIINLEHLKIFQAQPSIFTIIFQKIFNFIRFQSLSKLFQVNLGMDSYQYRNQVNEIQNQRTKFVEFMESQNIDVIISPVFNTVSGKHNFTQNLQLQPIHTLIYNLLDFPAGVVPITVVKQDEQCYKEGINQVQIAQAQQVMQGSIGMPVGIQVASLPFQEETVLNIMRQIEQEVQFNKKHYLTI